MADSMITSLTQKTPPAGTEEFPVNDSGSDAKVTIQDVWNTQLGVKQIRNSIPSSIGTTGTLNLDFSIEELADLGTQTGDITFTTSNLAKGRSKTIRIKGNGSTITLPSWILLGGVTSPITLANNKYCILTMTSFGTTDADVVCAYAVQS